MAGDSKTFGKSEAKRNFNLVPKVFSPENEKTLGVFKAGKRSAQASAHPLSQAQGGLFCVLTVFDSLFVCH